MFVIMMAITVSFEDREQTVKPIGIASTKEKADYFMDPFNAIAKKWIDWYNTCFNDDEYEGFEDITTEENIKKFLNTLSEKQNAFVNVFKDALDEWMFKNYLLAIREDYNLYTVENKSMIAIF